MKIEVFSQITCIVRQLLIQPKYSTKPHLVGNSVMTVMVWVVLKDMLMPVTSAIKVSVCNTWFFVFMQNFTWELRS